MLEAPRREIRLSIDLRDSPPGCHEIPTQHPDRVPGPAEALRAACREVGLDATGARLIRLAENAIYELPGPVVARVSRPGMSASAAREITVSRWLQEQDFPVVRALPQFSRPVEVGGRSVTFWELLPPHVPGSPEDVGGILQRLHRLPAPVGVPPLDPFAHLEQRIATLAVFPAPVREWLLQRLADLRARYAGLPPGLPDGPVHGDPWAGNVVSTEDGPVLIDLERFSVGRPEYDLVVIAAAHTSYGMLSVPEYQDLVRAYGGFDVTRWSGYPVLRDIRELRVTTFAGQVAADHPSALPQAEHRVNCLLGERGPRPWTGWHAVP